ncbi:hypothetical protein [Capnocytophaga cynodegmi]|uniref:Uncharacterized protein n=1 Tax=Capnocytophaga cynodegmi TaxID=28189 RepID=A0A0B7H5H6_9FLAO|nr:hypothetical protein [Capnocytophaga cynodegmi]CEN34876.1 hypothetical protein CCYN2B_240008 [Capnocytophaga cynodegmi]
MIGKKSNKKKISVEVKGGSSSGLTPTEKQQIEKIATLEKEIIQIKEKPNFKGVHSLVT